MFFNLIVEKKYVGEKKNLCRIVKTNLYIVLFVCQLNTKWKLSNLKERKIYIRCYNKIMITTSKTKSKRSEET